MHKSSGIVLSIFCAVFGSLPIILNSTFNTSGVSGDEIPLQKATSSLNHQYSIIACLGAYSPLVLELIADSVYFSYNKRPLYGISSLWVLVLSVNIPNIIILSNIHTFETYYYHIPWIFGFRNILVSITLFSAMAEYGTPVWTNRNTSFWVLSYAYKLSSWANTDSTFLAGTNYLLATIDIISRKFYDKELIDTIEDIENSVDMAVEILNNLIIYDKLSTNILTLETSLISVRRFVGDSVQPFFIQAREKGVHLRVDFKDHCAVSYGRSRIRADHSKLGQVLRHIVSNALKFSRRDGKVIVNLKLNKKRLKKTSLVSPVAVFGDNTMAGTSGSMSGSASIPNTLRIDVIDNGPGISPQQQQQQQSHNRGDSLMTVLDTKFDMKSLEGNQHEINSCSGRTNSLTNTNSNSIISSSIQTMNLGWSSNLYTSEKSMSSVCFVQ
eukprot:gene10278-21447_t